MLTTEQLNAIKERAEKATAGPWIIYDEYCSTVESAKNGDVIAYIKTMDKRYSDMEFIAHAREDIPALLQSIDELKKALLDTTDESDTFRENLKTIEKLTECETTRDFATRALKGEATLRIGGGADD